MARYLNNIDWHPEIGDPTLLGWATVGIYVYAVFCSLRVFRASGRVFEHADSRHAQLWLGLTVCLAFLALNKQLDLQSLMTEVMKQVSIEQGWYQQRRRLQMIFIVALGAIGALVVALLWLRYRSVLRPHLLALTGFTFLLCFILMRAASFHNMDYLLREGIWPGSALRMNHVLELTGITLIIVNAHLLLRRK